MRAIPDETRAVTTVLKHYNGSRGGMCAMTDSLMLRRASSTHRLDFDAASRENNQALRPRLETS